MTKIHKQRVTNVSGGVSSAIKKVTFICTVLLLGIYLGTSWEQQFSDTSSVGEVDPSQAKAVTPAASTSVAGVACEDKAANKATSPVPTQTFLDIAIETKTDKVEAHANFKTCLDTGSPCICKECENPACAPWGHFYDTIYDRWLKPYSGIDADPIQFLEVGFYTGLGYDAYTKFLPRAETHSMEIGCGEGQSARKHPRYAEFVAAKRLHCGDASSYEFLHKIWTTEMKRPDAPPLKVVIDDASHQAQHMAASLFFWLPRIQPGGIFVVEDIQPLDHAGANEFRLKIIPQVMKDIHWCGDPALKDTRCFPELQPFISGVHCEMHICVFVRNDKPAIEPDEATSVTPKDAFTKAQKCLFGPHD
jgi:hypothetical protein